VPPRILLAVLHAAVQRRVRIGIQPGVLVGLGVPRRALQSGRLQDRRSLDTVRSLQSGRPRGGRLRCEIGRRGGHRGLRGRVDGDRELDIAAEFLGQGLGNQGAQSGLQLLLDELVRGGDQRGVLDQAERAGELQPGPLVRLDLKIG